MQQGFAGAAERKASQCTQNTRYQPTMPQVFVNGEFIGGCDILMGMHDKNELEPLLEPIRKEQAAAAKK